MIQEAFQILVRCCDDLEKSLSEFRQVVTEDKPVNDDLALVDIFGDTLTDLLGRMHGVHEIAEAAYRSVGERDDLEQTRRNLIACQKEFNYTVQQFRFELSDFERIEQVVELRRRKKGSKQWNIWVDSVKDALIHCEQPLFEVQETLLRCWQEITEYSRGESRGSQTRMEGEFTMSEHNADALGHQRGENIEGALDRLEREVGQIRATLSAMQETLNGIETEQNCEELLISGDTDRETAKDEPVEVELTLANVSDPTKITFKQLDQLQVTVHDEPLYLDVATGLYKVKFTITPPAGEVGDFPIHMLAHNGSNQNLFSFHLSVSSDIAVRQYSGPLVIIGDTDLKTVKNEPVVAELTLANVSDPDPHNINFITLQPPQVIVTHDLPYLDDAVNGLYKVKFTITPPAGKLGDFPIHILADNGSNQSLFTLHLTVPPPIIVTIPGPIPVHLGQVRDSVEAVSGEFDRIRRTIKPIERVSWEPFHQEFESLKNEVYDWKADVDRAEVTAMADDMQNLAIEANNNRLDGTSIPWTSVSRALADLSNEFQGALSPAGS